MANRPTQLGDNWFAFPFHLLATASPPLGQECERTLTNEVVAGRTSRDERGWRATFYTTGLEHSPTSATGTAWERTSWRATRTTRDKEKTMLAEWLALVPLSAAILLGFYFAHPRPKTRPRRDKNER
jgi:hypothetical protein